MKLRLVLASLLTTSVASAQAPGEADLAPPGMAPAVVVAPPPPPIRRLSVGLGIGGIDLAPHAAPDDTTSFSLAQVAVRYLATRHLEIELAVAGGRQDRKQSDEWGASVQRQVVLGVRWRFNPQRRWNWWVMAGMGSLSITGPSATEEQRDAASQSTLQFGAGLERRFHRFAIQAEMRAVGVAPNEGGDMPMIAPRPPMDGALANDPYQGKSGGQFAISGNYYF